MNKLQFKVYQPTAGYTIEQDQDGEPFLNHPDFGALMYLPNLKSAHFILQEFNIN